MNITYLITRDPEPSLKEIMEEHKKSHQVTEVDVRKNKNYEEIVDKIVSCDKVISI